METYEYWKLAIDFAVGLATAGAVIYAARTASRWQKVKQRDSDIREIAYYSGKLSLIESAMFFHLGSMVGEDVKIGASRKLLNNLENDLTEIKNNKARICQLVNMNDNDVHQFLYLLISLDEIIHDNAEAVLSEEEAISQVDYIHKRLECFVELFQKKQVVAKYDLD